MLVALADHGLTPSAIAARLTLTGAPESVQGALAAGLLGGGSRYLGVTEDAGGFLDDGPGRAHRQRPALPTTDDGLDDLARTAVAPRQAHGRRVPGLGHPVHKDGDPRTPVLIRIADEEGLRGPHLRLFEAVGRVHPELLGRTLPLNGAGVCGAALRDLGFPVEHPARLRAAGPRCRAARAPRRGDAPPDRPGRSTMQVDRAAEYEPPAGG